MTCIANIAIFRDSQEKCLKFYEPWSAGFFIYGPQALVGIAAANIATKRAAATAGGFCGLFGYGSTIVSGWGMGMLVQYTDWSVALYTLVGMALVGTAVFAAAWKAKPNGYDD